jgi:hypothetical protein
MIPPVILDTWAARFGWRNTGLRWANQRLQRTQREFAAPIEAATGAAEPPDVRLTVGLSVHLSAMADLHNCDNLVRVIDFVQIR